MKWEEVELADIAHVVTKGTTPTTMGRQFTDSGVNYIKAEALNGDFSLESQSFSFIDDETHNLLKRSILQEEDILVTIAGAQVGKCGYVRGEHLPANTNQAVGIVRVNKQKADSRFIYYYFKQPSTFSLCQTLGAAQAAQPNVNLTVLKGFKIPLPSRTEQARIAETLSAYDDLMENNSRRMALLEESARLLYREWFVRLRFPSYEHARITNGIPEGWNRKTLGDICTDLRETVSPDALEPDTPYIGLEHLPRRSISLTEWGTAEAVTSTKLRYKTGDILFGKIRPYFHKVGIAFTDGVASSDAIVIRANTDELQSLVLMVVSSDEFVAEASQTMREGSKMPRADWKHMIKYPVVFPPQGLLADFTETVTAITDQLRNLCFQNQKLRAARDLLLPKLMSGELAV
ncbi:MAG: restriction endonuclease subunit S [Verrucomicrobiota bacterium]